MFEFKTRLDQIPSLNLLLFFIIVAVTGIVLFRNSKKDTFSILLFLLFYEGLFNYFGVLVLQAHKVIVFLIAIVFFYRKFNKNLISKNDFLLLFVFFLFSVFFFISYYYNPVSFNFAFSQYFKYFLPVLVLLSFNHAVQKGININYYFNLILLLFKMQIFYSFVKLLLIGFNETVIGSVNLSGGSVAAILPIFAFLLIWAQNERQFSKWDWTFILLTLLIPIASNKRAIWFLMPLFVGYFYYFLGGRFSVKRILSVVIIIPLIFYFGVRFNPSLNKERVIWGSFDFEYVIEYAITHNTGGERYQESDVGYGRMGGNQALFDQMLQNPFNIKAMFGYGLSTVYATTYEEFEHEKFNLAGKSSVSGLGRFYLANGYFGVMFFILLVIAICRYLKEFKIRIFFILFFLFDLFSYSGIIFNARTISVLFVLSIIFISNRHALSKPTQQQRFIPLYAK
jgi:hypothetical protein